MTVRDTAVYDALQNASAQQLRNALRRQLLDVTGDDDTGDFVPFGSDDPCLEDTAAFEEARARWQRGDRQEALHYLEIALGSDFRGLGDIVPEGTR